MTTYILGFSGITGAQSVANGHNPAAALVRDGKFVAGAAEERFNRVKDSLGVFPRRAVQWVLDAEGITLADVSAIAWANDPVGALRRWGDRDSHRVARRAVRRLSELVDNPDHRWAPYVANILDPRFRPAELAEYQRAQFVRHFGEVALDIPFECVDHHFSHAASAYYPSGFDEATVLTWDGSGDGLSTTVRHGRGGDLRTVSEYADFSIGEMYWAIHSYLKLSDEGSLMGLAAYGTPNGVLDRYVRPSDLWVDLKQLKGYHQRVARHVGFSPDAMSRLAPWRHRDGELLASHRDLAADLQDKVERLCFEVTRRAVAATGCRKLAISGGVALNAVFNGKLGRSTDLCEELFVQPNPGDEGGALGAAYVATRRRGIRIDDRMSHAYHGPRYSGDEIERTLKSVGVAYTNLDDDALIRRVSQALASGQVVGWFQGPMEWGPRALGNRSILADPRDAQAGQRVNVAVKYRDPWRPFAPSMLAEAAADYLVDPFFSPFMITTFHVRDERRSEIPSVVHADGTTRPQMVTRETNPRYYDLIRAFGDLTGTPVLLNTSFNLKGEPIVNTPLDALRTFFSSGLDVLVMENYLLTKAP